MWGWGGGGKTFFLYHEIAVVKIGLRGQSIYSLAKEEWTKSHSKMQRIRSMYLERKFIIKAGWDKNLIRIIAHM